MPKTAKSSGHDADGLGHSDHTHDAGFLEWRDSLRFFDMDGERFYLPTGDIPMDQDEVLLMWERIESTKAADDPAGRSAEHADPGEPWKGLLK